MELLPKLLVVGLFAPTIGIPGGVDLTRPKINNIWTEVSDLGYRTLEFTAGDNAARFQGDSEDEAVLIQPPLIQVREKIHLTAGQSADKAQTVIKTIARFVGVTELVNLGIRHVYWAPAPSKDARAFLLRVIGKEAHDLGPISIGDEISAGVKFVTNTEDVHFTLIIEPLFRDISYLYVDLDAAFLGPVDLDAIKSRAADAERYLTGSVAPYLSKLTEF